MHCDCYHDKAPSRATPQSNDMFASTFIWQCRMKHLSSTMHCNGHRICHDKSFNLDLGYAAPATRAALPTSVRGDWVFTWVKLHLPHGQSYAVRQLCMRSNRECSAMQSDNYTWDQTKRSAMLSDNYAWDQTGNVVLCSLTIIHEIRECCAMLSDNYARDQTENVVLWSLTIMHEIKQRM